MAAPSIFTEKELAFLRELVRQRVAFMVVGLSAAALQGAPAVTQDIDLWFKDLADPKLKKALDRVAVSMGHRPAPRRRCWQGEASHCSMSSSRRTG